MELQKGDCFIAQLDGQSVGHLMLFHGEKMACFQDVVTYPEFRGKGICHALVYRAALYARQYYDIDKLIIIAEKDSRAQKIYQNLGFGVLEEIARLYKSTF